jgi:SAM-dependent methyltransferase
VIEAPNAAERMIGKPVPGSEAAKLDDAMAQGKPAVRGDGATAGVRQALPAGNDETGASLSVGVLSGMVLKFLDERRQRMGELESGLNAYYGQFVKTSTGLAWYDESIADFIESRFTVAPSCLDVGAGVGQLSALLAARGIEATAIEYNGRTFAAASDLKKMMQEQLGISYGLELAFFPDPRISADGSLVIFTNVLNSNFVESAALRACRRASGIIMDLVRFGVPRGTAHGWGELSARVMALGFQSPIEILSIGGETGPDQSGPTRLVYFARTLIAPGGVKALH